MTYIRNKRSDDVAVAGFHIRRRLMPRLLTRPRLAVPDECSSSPLVIIKTEIQSRLEQTVPKIGAVAAQQNAVTVLEILDLRGSSQANGYLIPMILVQAAKPLDQPRIRDIGELPPSAMDQRLRERIQVRAEAGGFRRIFMRQVLLQRNRSMQDGLGHHQRRIGTNNKRFLILIEQQWPKRSAIRWGMQYRHHLLLQLVVFPTQPGAANCQNTHHPQIYPRNPVPGVGTGQSYFHWTIGRWRRFTPQLNNRNVSALGN